MISLTRDWFQTAELTALIIGPNRRSVPSDEDNSLRACNPTQCMCILNWYTYIQNSMGYIHKQFFIYNVVVDFTCQVMPKRVTLRTKLSSLLLIPVFWYLLGSQRDYLDNRSPLSSGGMKIHSSTTNNSRIRVIINNSV